MQKKCSDSEPIYNQAFSRTSKPGSFDFLDEHIRKVAGTQTFCHTDIAMSVQIECSALKTTSEIHESRLHRTTEHLHEMKW